MGAMTCLCLMLATERRAYGYVDPGSGLLALQSIGSVAAAAMYFMRRQIKALFTRKSSVAKEAVVVPMDSLRGVEKRNVA